MSKNKKSAYDALLPLPVSVVDRSIGLRSFFGLVVLRLDGELVGLGEDDVRGVGVAEEDKG